MAHCHFFQCAHLSSFQRSSRGREGEKEADHRSRLLPTRYSLSFVRRARHGRDCQRNPERRRSLLLECHHRSPAVVGLLVMGDGLGQLRSVPVYLNSTLRMTVQLIHRLAFFLPPPPKSLYSRPGTSRSRNVLVFCTFRADLGLHLDSIATTCQVAVTTGTPAESFRARRTRADRDSLLHRFESFQASALALPSSSRLLRPSTATSQRQARPSASMLPSLSLTA
jgi:hypothetical protein